MPKAARNLLRKTPAYHRRMSFTSSMLIGFFLGFAFGVGCALAVMYSIYLGGYRAAVRDSLLASHPPRFAEAVARLARGNRG